MKCPQRVAFLHLAMNWPVSNSRTHDGVRFIEMACRTDPWLVWHSLEWDVESGQPAPRDNTPASVPNGSADSRCSPCLGIREENVLCFT